MIRPVSLEIQHGDSSCDSSWDGDIMGFLMGFSMGIMRSDRMTHLDFFGGGVSNDQHIGCGTHLIWLLQPGLCIKLFDFPDHNLSETVSA